MENRGYFSVVQLNFVHSKINLYNMIYMYNIINVYNITNEYNITNLYNMIWWITDYSVLPPGEASCLSKDGFKIMVGKDGAIRQLIYNGVSYHII